MRTRLWSWGLLLAVLAGCRAQQTPRPSTPSAASGDRLVGMEGDSYTGNFATSVPFTRSTPRVASCPGAALSLSVWIDDAAQVHGADSVFNHPAVMAQFARIN